MDNLAGLFQDQGKLDLAEEMMIRAVDGKERILGKEHLSTLSSVNGLANIFEEQGRHEEALLLSRRARLGATKIIGSEHPEVMTCAGNYIYYT